MMPGLRYQNGAYDWALPNQGASYVDVPDPIDITATPEYQAWKAKQDQVRSLIMRQQAPPQFTPERMDPRQALIGGAVAGLARLFGARNAGSSLAQYLQGVQGQVNQRNQDAYSQQMQGYQRDQFNQNRDMQVANLDERTAAEIVNQIQKRGEAVRKAAIDRNKAISDYAQQQFDNSVKLKDLAIKDRGVKLRETPKWIQRYNAYIEKGWPEDLAMQKADIESGYTLGKAKVEQTRADTEFTKTRTAGYPQEQEIKLKTLDAMIGNNANRNANEQRRLDQGDRSLDIRERQIQGSIAKASQAAMQKAEISRIGGVVAGLEAKLAKERKNAEAGRYSDFFSFGNYQKKNDNGEVVSETSILETDRYRAAIKYLNGLKERLRKLKSGEVMVSAPNTKDVRAGNVPLPAVLESGVVGGSGASISGSIRPY